MAMKPEATPTTGDRGPKAGKIVPREPRAMAVDLTTLRRRGLVVPTPHSAATAPTPEHVVEAVLATLTEDLQTVGQRHLRQGIAALADVPEAEALGALHVLQRRRLARRNGDQWALDLAIPRERGEPRP